jgi:hypothetical protein
MSYIGEFFRFVHVAFGAIGLFAFWVPVLAKKGAVNHVRFGKIFVWSAYVVLAAASIALIARVADLMQQGLGPSDQPSLFAFIVFLGYLTIVTFVIVRYGMQVLRHKADPAAMRSGLTVGLSYVAVFASAAVILYALLLDPPNKILLFALSPIGIANGIGQLRYMKAVDLSRRAWMYEHIGAMLGSGIAFHTAFAVFGSSRLFDIELTGWLQIVPWVAPAAIGIPAIVLWTRHYQRKFGELA